MKRSAMLEDGSVAASNVGSTIYLDGTVGSYAAKRKAENAAWNTPGVTNMGRPDNDNRLSQVGLRHPSTRPPPLPWAAEAAVG